MSSLWPEDAVLKESYRRRKKMIPSSQQGQNGSRGTSQKEKEQQLPTSTALLACNPSIPRKPPALGRAQGCPLTDTGSVLERTLQPCGGIRANWSGLEALESLE